MAGVPRRTVWTISDAGRRKSRQLARTLRGPGRMTGAMKFRMRATRWCGIALLLAAAVRVSRAQAPTQTWSIDSQRTKARFEVRHLVVSTVDGQFDRLSGSIRMNANDLRTIVVSVTIDVASIDTQNAARDADLRSAKFFDVATHPTITFVSKRVEQIAADGTGFTLVGDLSMHGVTRETTLRVEGGPWRDSATEPGASSIRATATGTLKRHDFGLTYNRVIEGAAVVGENVDITIDLQAASSIAGR